MNKTGGEQAVGKRGSKGVVGGARGRGRGRGNPTEHASKQQNTQVNHVAKKADARNKKRNAEEAAMEPLASSSSQCGTSGKKKVATMTGSGRMNAEEREKIGEEHKEINKGIQGRKGQSEIENMEKTYNLPYANVPVAKILELETFCQPEEHRNELDHVDGVGLDHNETMETTAVNVESIQSDTVITSLEHAVEQLQSDHHDQVDCQVFDQTGTYEIDINAGQKDQGADTAKEESAMSEDNRENVDLVIVDLKGTEIHEYDESEQSEMEGNKNCLPKEHKLETGLSNHANGTKPANTEMTTDKSTEFREEAGQSLELHNQEKDVTTTSAMTPLRIMLQTVEKADTDSGESGESGLHEIGPLEKPEVSDQTLSPAQAVYAVTAYKDVSQIQTESTLTIQDRPDQANKNTENVKQLEHCYDKKKEGDIDVDACCAVYYSPAVFFGRVKSVNCEERYHGSLDKDKSIKVEGQVPTHLRIEYFVPFDTPDSENGTQLYRFDHEECTLYSQVMYMPESWTDIDQVNDGESSEKQNHGSESRRLSARCRQQGMARKNKKYTLSLQEEKNIKQLHFKLRGHLEPEDEDAVIE